MNDDELADQLLERHSLAEWQEIARRERNSPAAKKLRRELGELSLDGKPSTLMDALRRRIQRNRNRISRPPTRAERLAETRRKRTALIKEIRRARREGLSLNQLVARFGKFGVGRGFIRTAIAANKNRDTAIRGTEYRDHRHKA